MLQFPFRRLVCRFVRPDFLLLFASPPGLFAQAAALRGKQRALGSGFSYPRAVALAGSGSVYVSDSGNDAVYEIVAAGTSFGTVNLGRTSTFLPLVFHHLNQAERCRKVCSRWHRESLEIIRELPSSAALLVSLSSFSSRFRFQ
jgi:hypothetical protein